MANLELSGLLDLSGNLNLAADGGKVMVSNQAVLVELTPTSRPAHCSAGVPVMMPPPPATPTDLGVFVNVINSFNKTVKIGGKPVVAQGMVMQGNTPTWPGMVLPSTANTGPVTANHLPINVTTDKAVIFPSGASATLDESGQ
jgi:uncharacterized Zn-binding protein involved in type VI secretion